MVRLSTKRLFRQESATSWSATKVNWCSYIRDDLCQKVYDLQHNSDFQFSGYLELDESLFGRKKKHGKGKYTLVQTCIFGITERQWPFLMLSCSWRIKGNIDASEGSGSPAPSGSLASDSSGSPLSVDLHMIMLFRNKLLQFALLTIWANTWL